MRGEHTGSPSRATNDRGSSPHARGALQLVPHLDDAVRLIPACAGSTCRRGPATRRPRAHPRMRGEHVSMPSASAPVNGSSPHARGARGRAVDDHGGGGLIPACAGSTTGAWPRERCGTTHPRMRGEHTAPGVSSALRTGSSPHARGAPAGAARPMPTAGLIPACAGSTPSRR